MALRSLSVFRVRLSVALMSSLIDHDMYVPKATYLSMLGLL